MKFDTFKCDVCGTQKGENNHWFRFAVREGLGCGIYPWNSKVINPMAVEKHLCSDACVVTAVQQWLSAQQVASTSESR